MTTEANKLREKIMNIVVSVLTAGLIGAFTWAWNLNSEIAVIKSNMILDKSNHDTAEEVLKEWSGINQEIEAIKRQLVNIWKKYNIAQEKELKWERRVSKLEIKQEICCD